MIEIWPFKMGVMLARTCRRKKCSNEITTIDRFVLEPRRKSLLEMKQQQTNLENYMDVYFVCDGGNGSCLRFKCAAVVVYRF
jgi:hypothetical protein